MREKRKREKKVDWTIEVKLEHRHARRSRHNKSSCTKECRFRTPQEAN